MCFEPKLHILLSFTCDSCDILGFVNFATNFNYLFDNFMSENQDLIYIVLPYTLLEEQGYS
jgi:hypothetical protein